MNSLPDNACRRFLLGIASEGEETLVEDAVLGGELDPLFLQEAEDGLIDDYLLSSMTHEERDGFTSHFLSTDERRQRLAFAAGLIEYARKQPAEERSVGRRPTSRRGIRAMLSWKRTALLAAAAAVLLATLAVFQQMQLRRQGQIVIEARNEQSWPPPALTLPSPPTAVQSGGQSIRSFDNQPIGAEQMPVIEFAPSTRGVGLPHLRISAHAQFVRFVVKLSSPLAIRYREVLVAPNGDRLWTQEFPASILPATKESTIVLPASVLEPGKNYHLQLERVSARDQFEELEDWAFHVVQE